MYMGEVSRNLTQRKNQKMRTFLNCDTSNSKAIDLI